MRRNYTSPVGERMVEFRGSVLEGPTKMELGGFVRKILITFSSLGVGGGSTDVCTERTRC